MSMKEEYTAHDMATAAADGFRDGQRAAQSAPAGEREAVAYEHWKVDIEPYGFSGLEAFQAGAAWQRTQAAGVPDVSAMARVLSDRSADACNIDRADNWAMYGQEYIEDVQAMLAAAPQPAPQQGDEVQRLREALETEQNRLTACGVAALGYFDGCADDYKSASLSDVLRLREKFTGLLSWAVGRWDAEVRSRPLNNVHRRTLDDTWRQVIRELGGDPIELCGPDHDALSAKGEGERT